MFFESDTVFHRGLGHTNGRMLLFLIEVFCSRKIVIQTRTTHLTGALCIVHVVLYGEIRGKFCGSGWFRPDCPMSHVADSRETVLPGAAVALNEFLALHYIYGDIQSSVRFTVGVGHPQMARTCQW
jgi:hypothetical protein